MKSAAVEFAATQATSHMASMEFAADSSTAKAATS
jgi:hypothetical protein